MCVCVCVRAYACARVRACVCVCVMPTKRHYICLFYRETLYWQGWVSQTNSQHT